MKWVVRYLVSSPEAFAGRWSSLRELFLRRLEAAARSGPLGSAGPRRARNQIR
ncbi:hypothetical protein MF672_015565 [Actinomadura sp. ATCC 31491]|uniref:Uncharacterized protein n=1 Tax=Actinomadura luzonensis TaxID=2805427 RepID=A0ABT0FS79_9ACTN|nr:hypothetical protein [Actinomadura luzonensis]MCK2215194.1 hypothetical protein [Actinomadura luzonensis]